MARYAMDGFRWYLAGPISNRGAADPNVIEKNLEVFRESAATLRAAGLEIVSPVELDHSGHDKGWSDYMRVDIAALLTCQGIIMLPKWQGSKGAGFEHEIAATLKFHIMFFWKGEIRG